MGAWEYNLDLWRLAAHDRPLYRYAAPTRHRFGAAVIVPKRAHRTTSAPDFTRMYRHIAPFAGRPVSFWSTRPLQDFDFPDRELYSTTLFDLERRGKLGLDFEDGSLVFVDAD